MFWNYLVVGVTGFVLGLIAEWGILRVRGKQITLPFISGTARNFTVAAVLLSVISLTTIYNVERTADQTAECNRQFREALAYNTSIAAQEREINDRAREISTHRRLVLDEAFAEVGAAQASGDSQRVARAIDRYNVQAKRLSKEYDSLIDYRTQLGKGRKPYPEPSCGLS